MIRCVGLTKWYGSFLALDGLDLTLDKGDLFGFIGPNGAGKTTTMKILATLLLPTEGEAFVGSYDVVRQPDEVRRLEGELAAARQTIARLEARAARLAAKAPAEARAIEEEERAAEEARRQAQQAREQEAREQEAREVAAVARVEEEARAAGLHVGAMCYML